MEEPAALHERTTSYLGERLRWLERQDGDVTPPRTGQLQGSGTLVHRCVQAIYRIELVLAWLFARAVAEHDRVSQLETEVADLERELLELRQWCHSRCDDDD